MIHTEIDAAAARTPERLFLITAARSVTYGQAARLAAVLEEKWRDESGTVWAFYLHDPTALLVGMVAAARLGKTTCALYRAWGLDTVRELAQRFGFDVVVTDSGDSRVGARSLQFDGLPLNGSSVSNEPRPVAEAEVLILTTGTTGPPKGALYCWSDLLAQARRDPRLDGGRWLLTYNLSHFAGFQVLVHAVANAGSIVIPRSEDFSDILAAVREHHVGLVSGTATFWRMFVGYLERSGSDLPPLEHITIGGEPVTEELLTRLRRLFPDVPTSQVFATTETGPCFSVRDGRPGFPVSYLEPGPSEARLRIVDGELHVRTPHSMRRYWDQQDGPTGSWHPTGDLVEIAGDRVCFVGRRTETINVGGCKVHPARLEETILGIKGVLAAHVYGIPNPISGQVVAVDLVLDEGSVVDTVIANLREACRNTFDRYHQPRRIRVVDRLETANQKVVRRLRERSQDG